MLVASRALAFADLLSVVAWIAPFVVASTAAFAAFAATDAKWHRISFENHAGRPPN